MVIHLSIRHVHLGDVGTKLPVFVRIHDKDGQTSEPLELKNSLSHRNQFERNTLGKRKVSIAMDSGRVSADQFDVATRQALNGVKKLEVWHEGNKHDRWHIDYVQVIDNMTADSYCFPVNDILEYSTATNSSRALLEYPSVNVPCSDETMVEKTNTKNTASEMDDTRSETSAQRKFTIRTKTGR